MRISDWSSDVCSSDLVAARHDIGPGPRERADIGFVRGVGPVALILHLERITIEAARDRRATLLVDQRADVGERLPRRDRFGEGRAFDAAVAMFHTERRTGEVRRVKYAEAEPEGGEIAIGTRLDGEIERGIGSGTRRRKSTRLNS